MLSLPFELPDELARCLQGTRSTQVGVGASRADVFRFDSGLYLKTVVRNLDDDVFGNLEAEARRLVALKERVPVPQLKLFVQDATRDYLLMTELSGEHPAGKTPAAIHAAVAALAAACRLFHDADRDGFPVVEGVSTLLEQAKLRVQRGLVDAADFDSERAGSSPQDVFDELCRVAPAVSDAVLTHGDLSLSNLILQGSETVGFVDVGRAAVSDRWRDLALCLRDIADTWGETWCDEFLRLYGAERDPGKMRFYTLLDELF
jgi:aminoglycoside 3'-phosphotransferase-2